MLTPSVGGLNIGHHTGVKCRVINGPQLFAFAGDQGQAGRFKVIAEVAGANAAVALHPLVYAVNVSQAIIQQLGSTGLGLKDIGANAVLSFLNGGLCHCCVFEGPLQPRLLDSDHFYVALGSGKLSADPFLRFVSDTFCAPGQPPKVHLATFLAVWVVQHVIDVNPGGVAGPIRVAVFERDPNAGDYTARELPAAEIDAHRAAISGAADALRTWRNDIQSGAAAGGVGAPPIAPAPAAIAVAGTAPIVTQSGPDAAAPPAPDPQQPAQTPGGP